MATRALISLKAAAICQRLKLQAVRAASAAHALLCKSRCSCTRANTLFPALHGLIHENLSVFFWMRTHCCEPVCVALALIVLHTVQAGTARFVCAVAIFISHCAAVCM